MPKTTLSKEEKKGLPAYSGGDWRVEPCQFSHGEKTAIVAGKDFVVARIPSAAWEGKGNKVDPFNARMLAGAKDMFESIVKLRSVISDPQLSDKDVRRITLEHLDAGLAWCPEAIAAPASGPEWFGGLKGEATEKEDDYSPAAMIALIKKEVAGFEDLQFTKWVEEGFEISDEDGQARENAVLKELESRLDETRALSDIHSGEPGRCDDHPTHNGGPTP